MGKVLEPQIKMSLLRKSIKGTAELGVGQFLAYGCSFIRLAILARLLSVTDFGIAATFVLTIALLEMSSNMSLNVLIVQSKSGDRPSFQGTAHVLQALRGLINAIALFVIAWPVAHLFSIPDARWAFQCLAIIPLLRGFTHLDLNRVERKMNFRPRIMTELVSQVLITAAAWPMAMWLKDYSVLLWLLVAKAVFTLVTSHLLAERAYRWSWDRSHLKEIIQFAWPLLLNGIFLFIAVQGDQFLVGTFYTMADLGTLSVAAALVMAVSYALTQVTNTVFLPLLSNVQSDPDSFRQRYEHAVRTLVVIAAVFGPFFILLGEETVVLVYGEKYHAAGILVTWLGAAYAVRLIRIAPTLAAVAKGDTKCVLYSSIVRASGVLFALLFAVMHMPLSWIAASAFVAEVLTLFGTLHLVSRRHLLDVAVCYRPTILAATGIAISAAIVVVLGTGGLGLTRGILSLSVWSLLCLSILAHWYPAALDRLVLTRAQFRRRLSILSRISIRR